MISFPDLLANALWDEGKFPSGGARTSKQRCREIVHSAIARMAGIEGVKLIVATPDMLKRYVETLKGRDPEDLTTITIRIGDLRELTKDIPSNYTSLDDDRRQPSECNT